MTRTRSRAATSRETDRDEFRIDEVTRNVQVQATLENKDHFSRARHVRELKVLLPRKRDKTIVIPATAVSYAPFGDSVFVIEKKARRENREGVICHSAAIYPHRRDPRRFVAVTKGLKAGEQVVSTGVFKLRNGMNVALITIWRRNQRKPESRRKRKRRSL